MPNRVIKDSIKCSKQIDSLTWFQEVMFYRLLVTADDFGRYYSNPQILKSELFPTKEDLTKAAVAEGLDKLEKLGLIRRYEVEETEYLEIVKWLDHQQKRATKSKFPGYQLKSSDINCNQMISDDINGNQLHPNSKSNTNTKSGSARAREEDDDGFISDGEAQAKQRELSECMDAAERVGVELNDKNMSVVTDLYAQYGKDELIRALDASAEAKKPLRYTTKILETGGVGKPDEHEYSEADDLKIYGPMLW